MARRPASAQLSFGDATELTALSSSTKGSARVPSPLYEPEPVVELEPEPPPDPALGIAEFYRRLNAAVAGAFPGEVWICGEIRGLRESKGHHYLELADASDNTAAATTAPSLEVACWAREWPKIRASLVQAGVELAPGLLVRVAGRVSVWGAGGRIRFSMTAIDVEALLGGIAAARRRLLAALVAEDLLEANRRLPVPLVPLRIGLVTSAGSEAYRDFIGQLERSGYDFDVRLEHSLVQGQDAASQLAGAIASVVAQGPDLVVVVRGGGAKGDLAAFDTEIVARAIATSPVPVWAGIGHTGDRTVADEVVARSLVTPTACGEAVVLAVTSYLTGIEDRARRLAGLGRSRLDLAGVSVARRAELAKRAARGECAAREVELRQRSLAVGAATRRSLDRADAGCTGRASLVARLTRGALATLTSDLGRSNAVLAAHDPLRQLQRGWSLTRDLGGQLVRHPSALGPGDKIVTTLAAGTIASIVESTNEGPT
jgi:exodeoxyribonuclease VII large subunit